MSLREVARILLPQHSAAGGFDHAAVDPHSSRLYVAHTSNDSVDVLDLRARRWVRSIPALRGVAGVWIGEHPDLLFTSNRGEDTASVFRLPEESEVCRVPTGCRPNGMAFDSKRRRLLIAGVGDRDAGEPPTATIVDVADGTRVHQVSLPGRTRWALYHATSDSFYVNIADPPCIAQIESSHPATVRKLLEIPARGPHGLEQDPTGRVLYCVCDDGQFVVVDLPSGTARVAGRLAGAPDVVWLNPHLGRLYVAVGDPGVVEVFQADPLMHLETVASARGGHTLTIDPITDEVHVFLPETHEDLVLGESRAG